MEPSVFEDGGCKAEKGISLGIYAKSVHKSLKGSPHAPLGHGLNPPKAGGGSPAEGGDSSVFCPVETRLNRFFLQSAAKRILRGSVVSRIGHCLQTPFKQVSEIHVFRSKQHDSCVYGNLQTCGSVWSCPVCAAKISERRRIEVKQAIDSHLTDGGGCYLLTLTTPHYQHDSLSGLLSGQEKALRSFWNSRGMLALQLHIGYVGRIRSLEVTHGRLRENNNGWHPHYHILIFSSLGLNLADIHSRFHALWATACKKSSLPLPDLRHGVRFDGGHKAAFYVAKMGLDEKPNNWGFESEMTKGHIKQSKGGETPFSLLKAFAFDNDKEAARLFLEFAVLFKGKRQLAWSSGLKARFSISESLDEEISALIDDSALLLGSLSLEDWRLVVKYRLRGEVLELGRNGFENVVFLIQELCRNENGKKFKADFC